MQTIHVTKKAEADGSLSIRLPLGQPEAEYEIVVIVQPKAADCGAIGRDWPADYFERTFGSIDDETFVRPPQGALPEAVDFD